MNEIDDAFIEAIDRHLNAGDDGLARCYVAKRGRELAMVRRDCLTVSERGRHVRRLRRTGHYCEANALEQETLGLIFDNRLKMTEQEERKSDKASRSATGTTLYEAMIQQITEGAGNHA
jgi:hypothetical protein